MFGKNMLDFIMKKGFFKNTFILPIKKTTGARLVAFLLVGEIWGQKCQKVKQYTVKNVNEK